MVTKWQDNQLFSTKKCLLKVEKEKEKSFIDQSPCIVKIALREKTTHTTQEQHLKSTKLFEQWQQKYKDFKKIINLETCPNILPFSKIILEQDHFILARQYMAYSIFTIPKSIHRLSKILKKWIAYQMFESVKQLHNMREIHGDIKTANFVVTSWYWVYLTFIHN